MQITATNKKVRVLLADIRTGVLVSRPDFQRRLVWLNKDKSAFIKTVLDGYPFPEIYIAAGKVDAITGEGKEVLVDGQQRLTTLKQYFEGSPDLKLSKKIVPYSNLTEQQKIDFLEYDVVVRYLGKVSQAEIKEVFRRINSTSYSLNVMEIHNSMFDGEMKRFAEDLAQDRFFEKYRVFSANDIRRMYDTRFALSIIITVMSTYFDQDNNFENFLYRYNDELENKEFLSAKFQEVFQFVTKCRLSHFSRIRRKADLFTLLVEVYRALIKEDKPLEPVEVGRRLQQFYELVDQSVKTEERIWMEQSRLVEYYNATRQGTNHRTNRISRGNILQDVINGDFLFDKMEN